MTRVVAAILERDGRVLVCRRRADQAHPLRWEFPGGKVEPGESEAEAAARELREELGIEARGCEEMTRYEFAYPGTAPIELVFLRVAAFEDEPRNLIFHEMAWARWEELKSYDFLEGDLRFLESYGKVRRASPILVSMPTIKMVEPGQNEFLAGLEGKGKGPNRFFRTMANRPKVLETFVPLYGAVMGEGSVARRVKELVYLTCSYANECAFCTAAHVGFGKQAGITEEEMRAVQSEQDHAFSEPERAAIRYARELTRTADAADTRAALLEHYSDEQAVELTLVAAMANFTNRFNNGLTVRPEK